MIPQKLGTLESVDLRQIWLDEARDFTPWLAQAENLQLLSNAVGLELEFEGMEMPVGPYKVDIVANETLTECRAVIENQLERTDHDHLGKVICLFPHVRRQRHFIRWATEDVHPKFAPAVGQQQAADA